MKKLDHFLTDPDLEVENKNETLKELYHKNKFLMLENQKLSDRKNDLEQNLNINKQIICALVDACKD